MAVHTCRHLSTVRPVGEQPQNGATITIAAADVSVNLLVQRFAHPSSSGIQELVLQHAGCGSPIEGTLCGLIASAFSSLIAVFQIMSVVSCPNSQYCLQTEFC